MSLLRRLAAGVSALSLCALMTGTAFATGSWPGHQHHPNIYSNYRNLEVNTFFYAPSSVDMLDKATDITVYATAYNIPATERLQVCYTKPYDTAYFACTEDFDEDQFNNQSLQIRNNLVVTDSSSPYYGHVAPEISAKGDFTIIHKFPSGPGQSVYNDPGYDDITVRYTSYPY